MSDVVIYTTPHCPYCIRAKQLLNSKEIDFKEIDVSGDAALRRKMAQKAGGASTVPQIFADGEHIGDCERLFAIDAQGKLDEMLESVDV